MEERIEMLEQNHTEIRQSLDNVLVQNDQISRKVDKIYDALKGNEFEKDQGNGHGGGVLKRLSRYEDKVDCIEEYIAKTKGRNKVIWGALTLVGGTLIAYIIKTWEKIFS